MLDTPDRPIDSIMPQLKSLFGQRISTNTTVCDAHGTGEGYHVVAAPDAVVYPLTTDEVSALAKLCSAHRVPIVPFGAGTSLEGHVAALHGGVCVDFSKMNSILSIHAEDMDAVVEPGVTRKQLNTHLRDLGLSFPIDPGADASIGGMAATRASGTAAVKYGTMKDNVLAMEVVMADGRVMNTASRARKSAAGYDLTRLFVGSEGTLGIITKVTVKLHGIAEATSAAVVAFPSVEDAVNCATLIVRLGIPVARVDLLDQVSMAAVNAYSKLDHKEAPTLFLEFEGTDASVKEQAEMVKDIAADFGGEDFSWATLTEDRNRLWTARHNLFFACQGIIPGHKILTTDVCVPISQLTSCITHARGLLDDSPLTGSLLGHVGDGNFHTLILFDDSDQAQVAEANRINTEIVQHAISLDGTCTGEHGIGDGKMKYLESELGAEAVDAMRALKAAFDPLGILNPGKIVT